MDDKTLKKLMKGIDEDVKVPKNLSAKISNQVAIRARQLERKKMIWSGIKISVALLLAIYALTGIIVNFMSGHVMTFLKSFWDVPSLLFSSDGIVALYERLPLISALLFVAATVYVIRHLAIRGLNKSPYVFATVITSFAVVVTFGSFVAGMAVGSNSNETVQNLTGSSIFAPVINTVGQHEYSNVGVVSSITPNNNHLSSKLVLVLDNGDKRIINVPDEILAKDDVKVGDEIAVVGTPNKTLPPAGGDRTYSTEGLSLVDSEKNESYADMEVEYIKVLTN